MKLRPVAGVALRQFYLLRGSPVRILPMFAWVAVDIILWGFISRYLASLGGSSVQFVPQLLGAVLFWDFFTRIMQGVTTAFLEDVWSRNFLNYFASPLRISEYVGGLIVTSICSSLLGLLVMLVLASGVFGLPLLQYGVLLVPILLLLFVFGIALGVAGSAMVLRFGPASEWLIWPLPAMLAPFAGVFYPVHTLPHWMQQVARALPPTYVFEALRAVVAGQRVDAASLALGGALALALLGASVLLYSRTYRYVVRNGLLARYSSESAG